MKQYATDAMSNPRSRLKLLFKNLRSASLFYVKKGLMGMFGKKFRFDFFFFFWKKENEFSIKIQI